ncbi:AMP-binding protein [Bacteroidia bacterium]|nr:AMP-binding protein [Bacteroidia bacterium]
MESKTLKELYFRSVEAYRSQTASAMFEGESLTFDDHSRRVEQLQAMLTGAGIGSGDRVALLSSNMPNWAVCYFAVVAAGMVVVPILPDFSLGEIDRIIAHSEARALLVSDKLFGKVSSRTVQQMNIVVRMRNLSVISQKVNLQTTPAEPRGEDTAAIIYTSGTTSAPKGVMLSHRNLCLQIEMLHDLFPVHRDDVFLSVLPLAHTYECSVGMIYPFAYGAQVVYIDRPPTVSTLLPTFAAIRPTAMLSVPLIIEKIYRSQVAGRFRSGVRAWIYARGFFRRLIHRTAGRRLVKVFGGRLRFFGIGGAKLDRQTERFLLEGRFPYAIGYGMTETAPLIAGATPDMVRLGSAGRILKGIKFRLDNINHISGEGELVVLTPCAMSGYYKNPEATGEVLTPDGWLHTRDLCRFDSDGFISILGRTNNMIVGPSGENIYPEEIEGVINSHLWVADSIVRQEKGALVALVNFNREEIEKKYQHYKGELSRYKEEIKADLLKYVNGQVGKFARISKVEETDEFVRTPTHKIKRFIYTRKKGQS